MTPPAEVSPAVSSSAEETSDTEDFGDFLNASPVFQSVRRAEPVQDEQDETESKPAESPIAAAAEPESKPEPVAPVYTAATAIAVGMAASDIQNLGVPKAQQDRVRSALLDLAGLLDAGELSWDALRGAVDFAMEHPAVARRVLPLLIPYLDRAA